jgi:hypothetical protein
MDGYAMKKIILHRALHQMVFDYDNRALEILKEMVGRGLNLTLNLTSCNMMLKGYNLELVRLWSLGFPFRNEEERFWYRCCYLYSVILGFDVVGSDGEGRSALAFKMLWFMFCVKILPRELYWFKVDDRRLPAKFNNLWWLWDCVMWVKWSGQWSLW